MSHPQLYYSTSDIVGMVMNSPTKQKQNETKQKESEKKW